MRFDIHTGQWFDSDFCENVSPKVNSKIFEDINFSISINSHDFFSLAKYW